jgi:hypothetical protein
MIDISLRQKIAHKLKELNTYEDFIKLLDDRLSQLKKNKITQNEYLQQTNHFFEKINTIIEYLDTYKYHEKYKAINQSEIIIIIIEAMKKLEKFKSSKVKLANYKRDTQNIEKKFYMIKAKYEKDIKEIENKLNSEYPLDVKINIPSHPNDTYKYALTKLKYKGYDKNASSILLKVALEMENPKITKHMKEQQYDYVDLLNRMINKAIEDGKTTKEEQSKRIKILNKARKAIDNNEIFVLKG